MLQVLFSLAIFLSASLLFVIQPMAAKMLLPLYGGTPAVWTTCMLFFQALLLAAYGYAWFLGKSDRRKWQWIHVGVCLLSLLAIPILMPDVGNIQHPEWGIFTSLLHWGLPLLVIGASAPLLQWIYSHSNIKKAKDPYFLYAASNVGSLIALIAYPWLIERWLSINEQVHIWEWLYGGYLFLIAVILCLFKKYAFQENCSTCTNTLARAAIRISWQQKINWGFLSFVPCSLMLGITFYITTDIAATPLFWTIPLALYLISFIITFTNKPLIPYRWVEKNILIFLIFPILGFIFKFQPLPAWLLIVAHLLSFFILALLCHGKLYQARPPVNDLTLFYFCIATGGVLAGLFNAIVAPLFFVKAYEYPLSILLATLCIPFKKNKNPKNQFDKAWFLPVLILILLSINLYISPLFFKSYHVLEVISLAIILVFHNSVRCLFISLFILFAFIFSINIGQIKTLYQARNFYGIKQVFSLAGVHALVSQNTLHGFQVMDYDKPDQGAMAYYRAVYPVVQKLQQHYPTLNTMIMGLGSGIMACQFRAGDRVKIVEIDHQMIEIATNPNLFTYLKTCQVKPNLVEEDGRIAINKSIDKTYQLIVMDAFNSDAIPVHLLTLDAFSLYQQKLTDDGVIIVNISNRHVNVLPIITAAGRALDLIVLHKQQSVNHQLGQLATNWVLLTRNEVLAKDLMAQQGWQFVANEVGKPWTDNYTNILSILRF